ncbi:hypothetical protein CEUSTIGMA_g541.t1 [Chlamydomonas eustigma]|uniref:Magnesium transporter n=1 Tax=Chlamydomonas eustigma TaxID=1157962 RepID=A0A250WQI6_9CHLO|nr:hypothetical protein CEUSTIGMA_g541.t1 [Chlamydomonas eustigma]|eukprot:GAX73088.1 hypothetical protein CEUSTIGMA_g541.t1 [Chlamydomonas eustigma]
MPITFSEIDTVLGPRQPEVRIETEPELQLHNSNEVGVDTQDDGYKSTGSGDEGGSATMRTVSKLGIQPRDLRFLELHAVSYSPPALLARENAIVVSFECIRCIITLTYVLVINPTDERVASLIEDLKAQLVGQQHKMRFPGESKLSDVASKLKFGRAAAVELPFELKALEICFDKIASELSSAATDLEKEALPALDNLTKRIHAPDLEAVRRVKGSIVRLKTRIESLHEVLEKFLNDDSDMHRLNLTAEELSRQSVGGPLARLSRRRLGTRSRSTFQDPSKSLGRHSRPLATSGADTPGSMKATSESSTSSASSNGLDDAEVAEVEMLLEAYDMHLEQALSRIQTLDEYIQDTEDLVNTALDQKRNELIACDLLLNSNIVALGLITTCTALLSMNIVPMTIQLAPDVFNQVAISSMIGTYILLGVFLLWAVKENLLVF